MLSVDVKIRLLTDSYQGCLFELTRACCSARQKTLTFFSANSLLRELKAFSATKGTIASACDLSNSFFKLCIAYLISHFWPKQSWNFFFFVFKV